MDIHILAVGRLKEDYLVKARDHYLDEIGKRGTIRIIEVSDEKTPDGASEKDEDRVRQMEGRRILASLPKTGYVIALDIRGRTIDTRFLAGKFEELDARQVKDVSFIIGGSLGLSSEVLERADLRVSFSRMTFPHQLFRIMLLQGIADARRSGYGKGKG
jgi:23S rRNA (pseudouridine1915-N3)-methyltransferase